MEDKAKAASFGELILEIFRVNGRLLASGDRLVAGLNLTSARWQILGAVARAPGGETVSGVARAIGLQRQGVQRIVNELVRENLLALSPNPHHRRASLVSLTNEGRARYEAAMRLREPWARELASTISHERLATAASVLIEIRGRLEASLNETKARIGDDGEDVA